MFEIYVADYGGKDVVILTIQDPFAPKLSINVNRIPIGYAPTGLAVDKARERLYVSNDNQISIVERKKAVVKNIRVGQSAFYPGLNATGTRLYVPNFRSDTLSVIDTVADRVIADVPVGHQPLQAVVGPFDKHVYVSNFASHNVSVVSTDIPLPQRPGTLPSVTIPVGLAPRGIVADPWGKFVYVVCRDNDRVDVIDVAQRKVVHHIPVQQGANGIALGLDPHQLWVGNVASNTISVLDLQRWTPVTTLTIDSPVQMAMHWPLVFIAEYNLNKVQVIDRRTFHTIVSAKVGVQPYYVVAA